jgi:branched-chain amino acid transport system substrate-binding protein
MLRYFDPCSKEQVPTVKGEFRVSTIRTKPFKGVALLGLISAAMITATVGIGGVSGAATKPTGSPIKVGLAVAQTGEEGDLFATGVPTANAWAKWVNSTGGIGGHPVKILVQDTQSSTTGALAAVKTLVSQGVVAVVSLDAISEGAMGPYLQSQNVPILGVAYSPALAGLSNDFSSSVSTLGTSLLELQVSKSTGKTKFTSVYCSEAPSCAQAGQFYKGNAPAFGVSFKGALAVSASQPSYTAECLQAINSGSNFIQMDLANSTRGKVASACQQQGYTGIIGALSEEVNIPAMNQVKNTQFAGSLNSFPWWVNSAPVNLFRSAMAKYAPSTNYQNTAPPSVWTALQLFKAALGKPTGTVTTASVMKSMDSVKNQTLGGLIAQPLTFTAGKPAPAITCGWTYTFKSGGKQPKLLPVKGKSGNGSVGALSTTCPPAAVVTANEKAAAAAS